MFGEQWGIEAGADEIPRLCEPRRPTNGRLRNGLTLSNPLTWTEPREVKRSALASPGPWVRTPVRSQ
jgi:hypothetical protein